MQGSAFRISSGEPFDQKQQNSPDTVREQDILSIGKTSTIRNRNKSTTINLG